jgi:N-acyl-D-amino-acid deacylase
MGDERYETIIRGGTVVDGTGAAGRTADLGIRGGRIAALGEVEGEAGRVIDASGLTVAPGFIDVHSHDDVALINMPDMDFKSAQGVTTVVCGNCGAGAAPANDRMQQFYRRGVEGILGPVNEFAWRSLPEFYDAVRAAQPSVNAAFLVPHGALRVNALGWENRPPSGEELETMRSLLAEGMEAGAVGLSTGLIYAPGAYAKTDELIELAKVVSRFGGIYVSHIRNEGAQLLDAVREAIRIGEEGGCGVQISHHKASGKANFGKTKESLPVIDEARSRGLDVTIDAYPYVAASTALAAIAPRGQLVREMDPHDVMVASVKYQHHYEGKRLDEIASMMDLPVEEATSKLLRDEENGAVAVMFTMDEPDIRRVFSHETCMVGSDGIPSPTGKPHPRLYGTFARVLGQYVREEGILSIEEAVRRMTSLPATKFGLGDRGVLREGAAADVVVFDPATVADVATYEEPRQYPSGIAHVLVNGEAVVSDGAPRRVEAGAVIRRGEK